MFLKLKSCRIKPSSNMFPCVLIIRPARIVLIYLNFVASPTMVYLILLGAPIRKGYLMSSVYRNKTEQGRAVPKKPFILVVYRGSTYACVQIHVHLLTRSKTHVKVYTTVSIDNKYIIGYNLAFTNHSIEKS